jgi:tetratricopeptide (TPR) repeat protein
MSCIDITRMEAWLSGEDAHALDTVALAHLRTCPVCHNKFQTAMALKFTSMAPNVNLIIPAAPACSKQVDDTTRLGYLDNTMENRERVSFERHLSQCPSCQAALLHMESEIADFESGEVEAPAYLMAKGQTIGEEEIARHESKDWAAPLRERFSAFTTGWMKPQWVAATAVLLVAAVASVAYFNSLGPKIPIQQARTEVGSPLPTNPSVVSTPSTQPPTQAPEKPLNAETVTHVQRILVQIERVADGLNGRKIQLRVVPSDEYIAQISPTGELDISTKYIAATQNDDELAFLLAHEISHRQHPANCILSFSTSIHQPTKVLNAAEQRNAELEADRMGVFLASVAGFHAEAAERLFSRLQTIPNISDASHPEFSARLKESSDELKSIVRSIELFQVGISFFNTKQYSRSAAVFETVAKEFPSREAFNDSGLAHHKLALEYSSQNWGFKKSVILDPVARAIEPVREEFPQADLFSEFLNEAIAQYRQAITRDPAYVAVRINLASALEDKSDYPGAIRELEAVLKMSPSAQERARTLNNLGVIAAKQSQLEKASAYFKQAVKADTTFSDPHFNLARISELQNNPKEAVEEYSSYAQLAGNERDGWLRMAYSKLNKAWKPTAMEATEELPRLGRLQLGQSFGSVVRQIGQPTLTWKLSTPTQFDFFVSLFEQPGVVMSGTDDIIDFVQTTHRYTGFDSSNRISEGMAHSRIASLVRQATRLSLPGARESYINFDRGLGVNLRSQRVDGWFIFEPND